MSIVLGRIPVTPEWQRKNSVLSEMGSEYKIRLTSQSPYYSIRALHLFRDGSRVKSTGIRAAEPDALERVFRLCLDLEVTPDLLDTKQKPSVNSGFSAWGALSLKLEAHLRKRGVVEHHTDYQRHLKQLSELTGAVTPSKVQRWVEQEPHDSRERRRKLVTLNRIIELGVQIDVLWLTRVRGECSYNGQRSLNPRRLPTDAQIKAFVDAVPNPLWQRVYGLIATYGLRPHEVFALESKPDSDGFLEISDISKTGYHVVMPAHPEWVEHWGLIDVELPAHQSQMCLKQLGKKVTTDLYRRRNLTTWAQAKAYDLRHAWAARIHTNERYSHIGIVSAARMMGHTEKVHRETYLRWVEKKELKDMAKREARSK